MVNYTEVMTLCPSSLLNVFRECGFKIELSVGIKIGLILVQNGAYFWVQNGAYIWVQIKLSDGKKIELIEVQWSLDFGFSMEL